MKPGLSLLSAALLWLLLGAAAFFSETFFLVWIIAGCALLPVIVIDFLIARFLTCSFESRRSISAALCQGIPVKATLTFRREKNRYWGTSKNNRFLEVPSFLPLKIRIFDLYPSSMDCSVFPAVLPRSLFTQNAESVSFEYTLTPQERGPWFFPGLEMEFSSPLFFWRKKVFHKTESAGRTYPDFSKIRAAQAGLRGLLEKTGAKIIRRRGQGLEFRDLREYQEGDAIRDIDWRATSRRPALSGGQRIIVRNYQDEQDQQILFLLDAGYRLNRREGERTQFDSALEAVLLLSYISLKSGDSVAAGTFGCRNRWIAPRKGLAAFSRLENGLYDLAGGPSPSSPFSCLEEALPRLKRRTFIVMISNFREEDGPSLVSILPCVRKRHLLLMVSLREKESADLAARTPRDGNEALETAAAFSYLEARRNLYRSWEHAGLLTLESTADKLSGALINAYLEVKREGVL